MTPDELWEKYLAPVLGESVLRQPFKDALAEYGEAVRAEAVSVCKELEDKRHGNAHNFACEDCAAAIEKMKLP